MQTACRLSADGSFQLFDFSLDGAVTLFPFIGCRMVTVGDGL
jgi:hypothetical protein